MNTPIRKLGVVASMLFCAVLVAASYIQVVQAPSLDARAGNSRVINDGYKKERGSILVDGKAIATSVKSNDKYVYQRQYSNGSLYALSRATTRSSTATAAASRVPPTAS